MVQETLEEAAENYGWRIKRNTFSNAVKANELAESAKQDFIAGAKWQQEQEKITTDDAYNEGFENGKNWQQERSYSFDELRLLLIERDIYLYNYYTTYKKSGIPMENVDKYIEDSHEYLTGRKQFKKK